MFNRIKEYLTIHPNANVWTAIICSITAMNSAEWVSLLSACGLFLSTVWGLINKAYTDYTNHLENKTQKQHDRRLQYLKALNESERYKVETQIMSKNLIKKDVEEAVTTLNTLNENELLTNLKTDTND